MRIIYFLSLLLLLNGCAGEPFRGPEVTNNVIEIQHFSKSKQNKYALILEGHNSTYQGGFDVDQLDQLSQPIEDPYIKRDVSETSKLAISKGYNVYLVH